MSLVLAMAIKYIPGANVVEIIISKDGRKLLVTKDNQCVLSITKILDSNIKIVDERVAAQEKR